MSKVDKIIIAAVSTVIILGFGGLVRAFRSADYYNQGLSTGKNNGEYDAIIWCNENPKPCKIKYDYFSLRKKEND